MPVTAGAYKISKNCKIAGSGPWLPSCCSRATLEIRPYCSRVLPYYPYTAVDMIHCSTSTHEQRSPTFFTLIARARVRYMVCTAVRYHKSTIGPFVGSPWRTCRQLPSSPTRGPAGDGAGRDAGKTLLMKQDLRCLASLDQQVVSRLLLVWLSST
jgi:hypothetical protein